MAEGKEQGDKGQKGDHRAFTLRKESDVLHSQIIGLLDKYKDCGYKVAIVQFYVNQISNISEVNQTVTVDVYLKINWQEEKWIGKTDDDFQEDENKFDSDQWWAPGVEVVNGVELNKQTPDEEAYWLEFPDEGVLAYTQRCIGTVSMPLYLHSFPFDTQCVPLSFESFHWKFDDMRLLRLPQHAIQLPPKFLSMSPTVQLPEWRICRMDVIEQIKHYDFEDRDYSQVLCNITLERHASYYISKVLLILGCIIAFSWLVFLLPSADLTGRTSISVTLFLAAITFSFVLSSALPRVAYNTKMDNYLLTSYGFVVASIVENVVVFLIATEFDEPELARKVDRGALLAAPALYFLFNVYWFTTCLLRRRRQRAAIAKATKLAHDREGELDQVGSARGEEGEEKHKQELASKQKEDQKAKQQEKSPAAGKKEKKSQDGTPTPKSGGSKKEKEAVTTPSKPTDSPSKKKKA